MSDTANEKAALDWAERMDRGEIQFDPYLTSLATRVRDLGAENDRLRAALGIVGDDGKQVSSLIDALAGVKGRVHALEEALGCFVEVGVQDAVQVTWNGDGYWALPGAAAQALAKARVRARNLLDGDSDGNG